MDTPVTTSYAGRQIVLEMLQSVTLPTQEQRVHLTSVGNDSKIVTGIQKAVQRYAVLLLTTAGDVHFDTNQGGELISKLTTGHIQNMGYLYHIFGIANSNALRIIYSEDAASVFGTVPDDERITNAELEDAAMDYTTGVISLTVKLTTAAGPDYTFVLPVNTTE